MTLIDLIHDHCLWQCMWNIIFISGLLVIDNIDYYVETLATNFIYRHLCPKLL